MAQLSFRDVSVIGNLDLAPGRPQPANRLAEELASAGPRDVGRHRSDRQAEAPDLAFDVRRPRNARQVRTARWRDELDNVHWTTSHLTSVVPRTSRRVGSQLTDHAGSVNV